MTPIPYGCDAFGRLTHVMLHRPGEELSVINRWNHEYWLFDDVPNIGLFGEEHDRYRELLVSNGVEVLELGDHVHERREVMARMPNLTYLHDVAVVSCKGAILSRMASHGRANEQCVVREALGHLGVPIAIDFCQGEAFEGCLLLSPEAVLVAETERHNSMAVHGFIRRALGVFKEVVYVDVPKARRYMHPDTIFNRITHRLALVYPPAFRKTLLYDACGWRSIDFSEYMRSKGVELMAVSDVEQRNLACTFVPLKPGVMVHYDTALEKKTQVALSRLFRNVTSVNSLEMSYRSPSELSKVCGQVG